MSKEVDGQKNIKIAFTLNAKRIFFDHVHFYFPVVKMRKTFEVLWGTFSRKTWRYIGTFRPAPATGVSRAHSRKCRTQASITQTTKKVNTLILKVITWQIIIENEKNLENQKLNTYFVLQSCWSKNLRHFVFCTMSCWFYWTMRTAPRPQAVNNSPVCPLTIFVLILFLLIVWLT